MAAIDQPIYSLNSGEVSRLALARIDLAKLKLACETQSNFLPHMLGPCMMRPGTAYLGLNTKSDLAGRMLEFYFDADTKAMPILTPLVMRVMVSDAYLSRPAVTAAIANGGFNTDLTSWTSADEAGAASIWIAGGFLQLTGTGTNYAFRDQQITCNEPNVEHALHLVVASGTVTLLVGAVAGDNSYLAKTLAEGVYSLAFTPTGNFWIRLGANAAYSSTVDSIAIEAAGIVEIATPWNTGDIANVQYDQSGDVLFCASTGIRQRRIERHDATSRSWGVAVYYADDGPFRLGNTSDVTLTPSATTGAINLTASRVLFKSGHLGALFRATHGAQTQTAALGAANQFGGAIRVSGLASHNGSLSTRAFAITITGTFSATVVLQRSIGAVGSWTDVESYTVPTTKTFDDALDNQIIFYRLGIEAAYTSGTATARLDYSGSSQTGIARVTSVTSTTVVACQVLKEFGSATATSDWAEGEWSSYRGFPAALALHDGRLFWEPGIKLQGSVSDAFGSHDDTVTGDSAPINRTIATGGLDGARWLLSLQRLIAGTAAQEISIRASAFDEPLTPTAFVARVCSRRGAARLRPLSLGAIGAFAGRNAKRLYKLIFDVQRGDYQSRPFDRLKPEMYQGVIKSLAVQRQPDNAQIWAAMGDGSAVLLTHDEDEDVEAMVPVTTAGTIEDVAVLPGTDEDDVYFIIARTINGSVKRYIEKLAKRSECVGGTLNKTIDCHLVVNQAPSTTIGGLGHLEGQAVVVWADGQALVTADAPKIVTGGQITGLASPAAQAVVGPGYTAQLKSVKLAYAAEHGTAMTMQKRVARVGLVMADVAWKGVRLGRDFTHMTGLPATYRGKPLTAGQVMTAYDAVPGSFGGGWDPDSRLCIQVQSPYCATIMGVAIEMATNEPVDEPPPPRDRR